MNVTIRGGGVAASCCAHLLGMHGIAVSTARGDRPALPVVMLSDAALALMRDVLAQPALFAGLPRIERRVVAWGKADPVEMPHAATIVAGAAMDSALAHSLPPASASGDFTIHAVTPLSAGDVVRFGERRAVAVEAALLNAEDGAMCWIESVEAGWLFLIPSGDGKAWLLCVGPELSDALAQSHHVAHRIAIADTPAQSFDPSPRLASQAAGADWIGCGTATIAFDPICGDGTAQAVREAILASAIIAAIRDGGDAEALASHYGAMLIATMRRHLQLCAPFYRTGGAGPWWRETHDALAQGHDWCTERLSGLPEPRYMLSGYRLIERERAA